MVDNHFLIEEWSEFGQRDLIISSNTVIVLGLGSTELEDDMLFQSAEKDIDKNNNKVTIIITPYLK